MTAITDYAIPWYHGSPHELAVLRAGSWVTPFKEVAKAFSHKPVTISASDDYQQVTHDGTVPGFLYRVAEPIGPEDIAELPGTARTHWQTRRDLKVELVAELPITDPPQITAEERERMDQLNADLIGKRGCFQR
ncbi:MAG: hypothetical protein ACYC6A_16340 [Armatimonadota bacterium]